MIRIKIIVNCGPCEEYIDKCICSVREQSWSNWDAFVTVDPCGDRSYTVAQKAAAGDSRFHLRRNKTRRYSMHNLIRAIACSRAEPEDVIVCLDGDDWFAHRDALSRIVDAYRDPDCWVTYGSWLSNVPGPSGRPNGAWPAYPEGDVDFRRHRFLGTAVRTWKKWLWDHLRDDDLRNESGDYARVSEDQLIMIPLLEMCGTAHARHIAEPIMIYNKLVRYSPDDSITREGERNGHLIDSRQPYPRLAHKSYRRKRAAAV